MKSFHDNKLILNDIILLMRNLETFGEEIFPSCATVSFNSRNRLYRIKTNEFSDKKQFWPRNTFIEVSWVYFNDAIRLISTSSIEWQGARADFKILTIKLRVYRPQFLSSIMFFLPCTISIWSRMNAFSSVVTWGPTCA